MSGTPPEREINTSSTEAEEKALSPIRDLERTRQLLTELVAKKIISESQLAQFDAMQPIHDELTMEQGMHTMAMKLVFKDIENQKPWGYDDFKMTFLKEGTLDVTQMYLHTSLYGPDYLSWQCRLTTRLPLVPKRQMIRQVGNVSDILARHVADI